LVSIRRNEETFALWRLHLSRGLDRVAEYRERGLWTDAQRVINEELMEARIALARATKHSAVLQRAAHGVLAFTLGAAGGALGAVPGGPSSAAWSAAGAGAGAAAIAMADGRGPATALQRHYVLFEPGRQ
jgi:hypothetical protein